jgi:hypothetical protein
VELNDGSCYLTTQGNGFICNSHIPLDKMWTQTLPVLKLLVQVTEVIRLGKSYMIVGCVCVCKYMYMH